MPFAALAALSVALLPPILGGAADAGPAAGPAPATIEVGQPLGPRFDGWGGGIVTGTVRDPQARPTGLSRRRLAALDRLVYGKAGINLLRIWGPGFRAPDLGGIGKVDDGPGKLNRRDGRWGLMRRARRHGVKLMFTASNAPVALKAGRHLAPGNERRFARYIANNLSFAAKLGAPFDLVAVGNEVDNGSASFIPLLMSPQQAATVYDRLAREIARRRLPTRLALGDNKSWEGTLRYATAALRSARVRRLARVIASHPYAGERGRQAVGELARRHRLRVWMTEWIPTCPQGRCAETNMALAIRWAEQISRDLRTAAVNAWFLMRPVADSTHGAQTGIIVRTRGSRSPWYLNKQFHVFRQFTAAGRPKSRRLAVSGALDAVAFRTRRRLSLVVTNPHGTARSETIDLAGRPGRLQVRRTSEHESFRLVTASRYEGDPVAVSLPARSVTTFTVVY